MTVPASRFIGGYANWRYNPFTAADMAVPKTEDHVTVPISSPNCLQLLESPRKNTPSSVVIYNYTKSVTMTEVLTSPILNQYRVDYPPPDGSGTGLIEFNSANAGDDIRVTYYGTGSPIVGEFLDALVPWPSPSPGQNQTIIWKSNVPTWAYLPKRYFHEGSVLHDSAGEEESCVWFRFKKGPNDTVVLLELKGKKAHQGFWRELRNHTHTTPEIAAGVTGSGGGFTIGQHAHDVDSHVHPAGTLAGSQPTHQHTYEAAEGTWDNSTQAGGNNPVTITGSTGSAGSATDDAGGHTQPGHTHTTPVHAAGVTGDSGTGAKTYPDQLKVYIDGVDKTSAILALLSGWTGLGNGNSTHVFVTTGTGEMDITSMLGAGTMHEIKITEPQSSKGGRVLIHCEVY